MAKQNLNVWLLRHDTLAKAIGLGSVAAILLLSVFMPSWQKVSELRAKLSTRTKEQVRLTEKMQMISSMDTETLAERIKVLDQALPPRKDVVLYLATIDGLSRELGLSFAGIALAPGDVTEASASAKTVKADIVKGVHTLETEVKINGSREKLYEFLRTIETTLPLMQIKGVQVSSLGLGEDNYALSLNLGMLWASRDAKGVAGTVELFNEKEEAYFQELALLRTFESALSSEHSDTTDLGKFDLFAPTPRQLESPQEESQ